LADPDQLHQDTKYVGQVIEKTAKLAENAKKVGEVAVAAEKITDPSTSREEKAFTVLVTASKLTSGPVAKPISSIIDTAVQAGRKGVEYIHYGNNRMVEQAERALEGDPTNVPSSPAAQQSQPH
jgi:hypothetical protein